MNPLLFIAASLASDANLDPAFSRAFQQTAALDRFREPDEPVSEWDGPDPDDVYESRRDERDMEEA
jgi:hypothetical protein